MAFYYRTGLDSATTFDVCAYLGQQVRQQGLTSAVVLLQPPPEVYDLFDDVLLLDNGRLIFHGPRQYVLPHFRLLGYNCPERKVSAVVGVLFKLSVCGGITMR